MSNKLSKELVKHRLDTDNEFKKYYNSLSEEEKKEIKELLLSHNELRECIRESYEGDTYIRKSIRELFEKEIKNRGQKSIFSKKAKIYARSKIFCYKLDNKHFIAVKFYPKKKSLDFEINRVAEVSSPKGNLYITESSPRTVFTAHFFDRYSERLNIQGNRDSAVFSFLIENWDESSGTAIDPQGNATTLIGKGLGLGDMVVDVVFLKTYISEEQINKYQHTLRKNINKHLGFVA